MRNSRTERGTILVVSLAIMFILGILGLVFIRIVAGSTATALSGSQAAVANELSKAGVRYSFAQLRFSEDGADWRPQPPTPVPADVDPLRPPGLGPNSDPENPAATNPDPDFFWLRRQVDPVVNDPFDRGGPDGLGAYTRINYRNGRALIRVRFAPSGISLFTGGLATPLAQPAKLRAYTIIDSVGRPGEFNALDPTSAREPNLQRARQLTAIASIGTMESARYISNKDNRTAPIELGIPDNFGGNYNGTNVQVPMLIGGFPAPTPIGLYPGNIITLGGPIYANGDLLIHGDVQVFLHTDLGDQINIYGDLRFSGPSSSLLVNRISAQAGSEVNTPVLALPSIDPNFTTAGGVLRDIREQADPSGYARSVPKKDPPLVDEVDPNTQQLRYRLATRDSGTLVGPPGSQFNLGRLGYGRGVYVDNRSDVYDDSEDGDRSLRYDIMNPNNANSGAWNGPFFTPRASHIQFFAERNQATPELGGFVITREQRTPSGGTPDTWRDYVGANTNRHSLTFKLGYGNDGIVHVINELTPGVVNFATPTTNDFDQGRNFNGVILLEGNVRVRGVIPTDAQITVVSMANAFLEGSITKSTEFSTLAILARQNAVLNTTHLFTNQFDSSPNSFARFGTSPDNPYFMPTTAANPLSLSAQFVIDPITGQSYMQGYQFPNGGDQLYPALFLALAGGNSSQAGASFFNLLINPVGFASPEYLFAALNPPNAAAPFYPAQDPIPTYGLGYTFQILPSFEKRAHQFFPIAGHGSYSLFVEGSENEFQLKLDNTISPNGGQHDLAVSRFSIQPYDVRIEAMVYAQEGSFYVLPGPWFNWNPNDRRDAFTTEDERFQQFGAAPDFPFYGEPLNIRINIVGSVSENFPASMADQSEWLRKWGWMPVEYGGSGIRIPNQHNPSNSATYVPNLFINYDPVLVTGRVGGSFDPTLSASIRVDGYGRELPPMPKLPVGTKLFYFGEVNP